VTDDAMRAARLAAMRRSYSLGGGILEPNAMVLATAAPDGAPSARTVLLKGLDERGLAFYTAFDSRKGGELNANPRAAVVFPWIELQRQVLVEGTVDRVSDEEADAYWATRPRGSQLGARASRQSLPIASRAELEEACAALAAEYPGEVPRPQRWGGYRLSPDAIEFWQGRPDRLHDRLRCRREGDRWTVERLAP
jgi:pyridoxamine 5'-phosphate oxidase